MSLFRQTRPEARSIGLEFYMGGRPCRNGHTPTMRYTSTANCIVCLRDQQIEQVDEIRARAKAWHKANAAKTLERQRERARRMGPVWRAQQNAAHRARKVGSPDTWCLADIDNLMILQKAKCAYCRVRFSKERKSYHIDHIMPLSLGGSNNRKNIQLLCPTCNLRKNGKHPLVFARQCGRLL